MGSKIYTRGGDEGTTSLLDGRRVDKDSARVRAYGAVDEACSWMGLARAWTTDPALADSLVFAGHRLYNCSSCLAAPAGTECSVPPPSAADTRLLEETIDAFEERCGPIRSFILPGGSRVGSVLHVARTVVRRAERHTVTLSREERVDPKILRFLNRVSDLLFAAARYANHIENVRDAAWDPEFNPPTR